MQFFFLHAADIQTSKSRFAISLLPKQHANLVSQTGSISSQDLSGLCLTWCLLFFYGSGITQQLL